MDKLVEFVGNHPLLCIIFGGLLVTLFWTFVQTVRGIKPVDPSLATQMINHDNAVIVDVRGENEFHEGHIVNAIHVPADYVQEHLRKLEKYRDNPIILIGGTGQSSNKAGAQLKQQGFKDVCCLGGGISAWRDANLPLTKK